MIMRAESMDKTKNPLIQRSIQAIDSLIKIPIIIITETENEVFLPITELAAKHLPPQGSVLELKREFHVDK